jgi:DNA-directed RNA polymerase
MDKSCSQTIKGIAPNFVHGIDASHVRAVVNTTTADIVHTHDDIGTHPEDYFAVNAVVRETFVSIHSDYDWFASLEEFSGVTVNRSSLRGEYDITEAIHSTYLFS